ncbi:site-specific DNA-methyltransferase [Anoxybacillus kestanbolensis]|uniref:site-specific DNA-methyltransferase n=1 Tax=Anoxybacillus kestanbolensis TaxID=227476 RepID=UPI003D1D911F
MEQNVTKNITAKDEILEVLQKYFSQCFDKDNNFNFEKFKKELQLQDVNFSKESYTLDWLGKSYARLLATDSATTLLKEDKEWNNKGENKTSQNLLIKGDNLEVLKHLSNAYYNKIKMIYIDPPYNTGNDDFVYQDDRKFTVEELSKLAGVDEEKAKRILDFVNSKSNSHSAWLTFMYPRLYIAKQLLKEDGVIFVSIDDNEVAQLRILMDEIFGENNFVGSIAWESKTKSQNTKDSYNKLQTKVEYILVYTRKDGKRFNLIQKGKKQYPMIDDKGKYREYPLEVMNADDIRGRKTMIFEIEGLYPPEGKQWKLGQETISIFKSRNDLFVRDGRIILKMRPEDEKTEITEPFWGFLDKNIGTAESAKKELSTVLNNSKHGFETVKPVNLIKRLIFHATNSNDLILDFFAGSGTTGHAVMQLNAEYGGNRKYILVQIPESVDPKKNKTAYDFIKNELGIANPTIFEITKERLVRAARKIKEEIIDKKIAEIEIKIKELEAQSDLENNQKEIERFQKEINVLKNQDLGFKIFETVPIWEGYEFKAEVFEEQLNLFDENKLTEEDIQMLLTTWKTYDGVPLTQDLNAIDLDGYTGYYHDTKIYLMFKGFEIKHLKKLLEEIDTNKDFNPATIIVFGYNFDSKTLREIAENVSSYMNKKSIDIDFIIRY